MSTTEPTGILQATLEQQLRQQENQHPQHPQHPQHQQQQPQLKLQQQQTQDNQQPSLTSVDGPTTSSESAPLLYFSKRHPINLSFRMEQQNGEMIIGTPSSVSTITPSDIPRSYLSSSHYSPKAVKKTTTTTTTRTRSCSENIVEEHEEYDESEAVGSVSDDSNPHVPDDSTKYNSENHYVTNNMVGGETQPLLNHNENPKPLSPRTSFMSVDDDRSSIISVFARNAFLSLKKGATTDDGIDPTTSTNNQASKWSRIATLSRNGKLSRGCSTRFNRHSTRSLYYDPLGLFDAGWTKLDNNTLLQQIDENAFIFALRMAILLTICGAIVMTHPDARMCKFL
jgi:hypothetical protein